MMPNPAGDPRNGTRELSTDLLLHRMRKVAPLRSIETELVLSIGEQPKLHAAGTSICPNEDGSPHQRLTVSGWACRPRILPDGRRQMLGLVLPGDLIGDRGMRRPLSLVPVVAITPVRTISVCKLVAAARDRPGDYPNIAKALALFERIEESSLLDYIVRLGCQNALQRIAHLLLELYHRLSMIGFVHNGSFAMPLTQDTIGELLGLSLVHVNRIVGQLRRENMAMMRAGVASVLDFQRLAMLADRAEPSGTFLFE